MKFMKNIDQFIPFFRQAAPYIHQHRNKTFVFCLQDDGAPPSVLKSLLHDIAVLHSLRVRVVIIFGVQYTLNKCLDNQRFHDGRRITDMPTIKRMQEIIGARRIQVESILSMGLANTPMQGASIQTVSGNFIIAKPVGIRDGVDFGLTGEVRSIRAEAIKQRLQNDEIVIIPPLGYSGTGEVFNLTTEAVARAVAVAINSDKLLFFNNKIKILTGDNETGLAVNPQQTLAMVAQNKCDDFLKTTIYESVAACQKGVKRIHIVPKMTDGALLAELFTRDGIGLMVTNEAYDRIEQATIDDITSLLELIRPLEKQGILVRRSRELLEIEIDHFSLLKRDNTVIGCAALYPYPKESMAELGCLVVNPDYQRNGLADKLLQYIEDQAYEKGIHKLFCLTTQASHWFMERGFEAAELAELPEKKQAFYNFSRNSQPYLKQL